MIQEDEKMKKRISRCVVWMLAIVLILTLTPTSIFAADDVSVPGGYESDEPGAGQGQPGDNGTVDGDGSSAPVTGGGSGGDEDLYPEEGELVIPEDFQDSTNNEIGAFGSGEISALATKITELDYMPNQAARERDNPYNSWRNAQGGNCIWYAYARVREIIGVAPHASSFTSSTWFTDSRVMGSCKKDKNTPKCGDIICWTSPSMHYAVVEEVAANGLITFSESNLYGPVYREWKMYQYELEYYVPGGVFDGFIHVSASAPLPQTSKPTITQSSYVGGKTITLSADSGAVIYYTTNGSTPTTSSTRYSSAFSLASSATVNAIAVRSGYSNSTVASAVITVNKLTNPTIDAAYQADGMLVTIGAQSGTIVYYTTNGTTPTTSSIKYVGSFRITATTTIKAIATLSGSVNSNVAEKQIMADAPDSPKPYLFETASKIAVGDPVKVKWDKTNNTNYYLATIYQDSVGALSGEMAPLKKIETSETMATFILEEKGIYHISVIAYNFVGGSVAASAIDVEAIPPCKVSFQDWDGTVITDVEVKYGGSPEFPAAPLREGYRFAGWTTAIGTSIYNDTDITALYTIEKYTVDFYDVNGTTRLDSQRIEYGSPAAPPANYTLGTGYIFAGWYISPDSKGTSVERVNGDMKVIAIKTWANPYLPIIASITKAEKNGDTYTINVSLINPDGEITRGRLITTLKTANDRMVASNTSDISLTGGSWSGTITLNSYEKATKAEVVAVSVDGDKTGGAFSEMVSAGVRIPAGWEYGPPGEWSTQAPTADQVEEKTQYRYNMKETATSTTSKTMPGYIYDRTVSTTGNWSGWQDASVSAVNTDALKREIQTQSVVNGYSMVTYVYQRAASPYYRSYKSYNVNGNYAAYGLRASYGYFNYYKDISPTQYSSAPVVGPGAYSSGGAPGYNDDSKNGYNIDKDGIVWFNNGTKYKTQYRYMDTTYIHYFYKVSDWSEWSDAEPPAGYLQKEERTMYRGMNKVYLSDPADPSGEIDGQTFTTSGKLAGFSEDFSGRNATVFVYKKTNDDPTQGHLVYVGQTEIKAENAYGFTFVPKEDLTEETGDFVVALALEGATRIINVDIKPAPIRKYTVTFMADNNVLSSQVVEEGGNAILPEVPQKAGYTFVGWDDSSANIFRNSTITAKYIRTAYNVILADSENDKIDVVKYYYGDVLGGLSEPVCDGKVFKGWYILADGAKQYVDSGFVVRDNTVILADWEPVKHTVTFVGLNDIPVSTQLVEHGKAAVLPGPPASGDMVFAGWSNDTIWWNVKDDITVKPIFVYSQTAEAPVAEREENGEAGAGDYSDEVNIIFLKSATENATVYYRILGDEPAATGDKISGMGDEDSVYSFGAFSGDSSAAFEPAPDELIHVYSDDNPIVITRDTTIRMKASAEGMNDSETVEITIPFIEPDQDTGYTNGPLMYAWEAYATPGDIVEMPVYLSDVSGIASMSLKLTYNENVLTRINQQGEGMSALSSEIPDITVASQTAVAPLNDGSAADESEWVLIYTLRFKVSDTAEPGVYPVAILPNAKDKDGQEIAIGFGSITSNVYVYDKADDPIPVVTPSYSISLNKTHLALLTGDVFGIEAQCTGAQETPIAIDWISTNNAVATVSPDGLVTAIGAGTAIIRAQNIELDIAAECKVDVTGKEADGSVKSVKLPQNTVTSNVLSTDYVRVPLQFVVELNNNGELSTKTVNLIDSAESRIESVKLLNDPNRYFTANVVDGQFVELVPNLGSGMGSSLNIIDAGKVTQLKTALEIVIDGVTFTTPDLTVKISRAKPSVKAAAIKFNSFFPDARIPVSLTSSIGNVTDIELIELDNTDYSKVIFDAADKTIRLKEKTGKPKKLVFRATVSGFAEGYNKYAITVKPSVATNKPAVKLNMKNVTMNKYVDLRITGKGIAGISVNNPDYSVTWLDVNGGFTLTYKADKADLVTAKANLKFAVSFEGTDQTVTLPFTVNKPYTGTPKVKFALSSVTLNKRLVGTTVDSAMVKITMTPWDAPMPTDVTGVDASRFGIDLYPDVKTIKITLADEALAGKSYKLKIGNAKLTVKVIDKAPVITLKAKGTINVVNPDSTVTLTPKFTNYRYIGGDVSLKAGAGNNDRFEIVSVNRLNGAVTLRMKDVENGIYKPRTKQSVSLVYSDERGDYTAKSLGITPKYVKPKLSQSTKEIKLQKNDVYSEGRVDLAVISPGATKITDVKIDGAAHNNLYQIRKVQNGSYAIGFKDRVVGNVNKGAGIKLNVYLAGSDKPMTISVKIVVS